MARVIFDAEYSEPNASLKNRLPASFTVKSSHWTSTEPMGVPSFQGSAITACPQKRAARQTNQIDLKFRFELKVEPHSKFLGCIGLFISHASLDGNMVV